MNFLRFIDGSRMGGIEIEMLGPACYSGNCLRSRQLEGMIQCVWEVSEHGLDERSLPEIP